jgi:filamin
VGHPAEVTIEARDKNGNPVTTGNDPFNVVAIAPDGSEIPLEFVDHKNGTYTASFVPETPAYHEVHVRLGDKEIANSPFRPLFEAANAGNSYVTGEGAERGKAGDWAEFEIHAVDADGNPISAGGDPFQVNVSGPDQNPQLQFLDNGNGTYKVQYLVETPGDYNVDVTLHGQPIKDAPFSVFIKPAGDAGYSYASGPGLIGAWDNEPAHFTIFSRDKNDQPRADGGDNFKVNIDGPESVPAHIVDNGDGTYGVTYEAQNPGDYVITVTLDDANIRDSPFSVQVQSGTDVGHSGLAAISFIVQTRDKHGNPKTFGGDSFEVTGVEHAQTSDLGDGTYLTQFHPPGPGNYAFHVSLNGKQVPGSPLNIHIP